MESSDRCAFYLCSSYWACHLQHVRCHDGTFPDGITHCYSNFLVLSGILLYNYIPLWLSFPILALSRSSWLSSSKVSIHYSNKSYECLNCLYRIIFEGFEVSFFFATESFYLNRFNQNFGVMGILDRFHGTDKLFRNSIQYQRHFFLTNLTPVSETFPEPKSTQKSRVCSKED